MKRIKSLDILRGLAVILMVLAHTIAFLYSGQNRTLNFLRKFGDTVCFVTFLFVSGATTYIAYLDHPGDWVKKRGRLLFRLKKLLIWYYVAALIMSLGTLEGVKEYVNHFIRVVLFLEMPGYTEFLIPFMIFGLMVAISRKWWVKISKSLMLIIISSVFAYTLGTVLYHVRIDSYVLDRYKAIFAGSEGLYRFPILQYLPVYLIGIRIGKNLKEGERIENLILAVLTDTVIILRSMTKAKFASFPYSEKFQRWPPSIAFISLGIGFALVSLTILKILSKVQVMKWMKPLILVGKKALGIYVVHVLILRISQTWLNISVSSSLLLVFSFVIVLVLSYVLTFLIKYSGVKRK